MNTAESEAADQVKFLVGEDQFLDLVGQCLNQLQTNSVGSRLSDEALKSIETLNKSVGKQMNERLAFRERMAAIGARGKNAPDVALFPQSPVFEQVKRLKKRVRAKTLTTQQNLRATMLQLTETQVVVTAVLETVLGITQDDERYDSKGRPVKSTATARSIRVA